MIFRNDYIVQEWSRGNPEDCHRLHPNHGQLNTVHDRVCCSRSIQSTMPQPWTPILLYSTIRQISMSHRQKIICGGKERKFHLLSIPVKSLTFFIQVFHTLTLINEDDISRFAVKQFFIFIILKLNCSCFSRF